MAGAPAGAPGTVLLAGATGLTGSLALEELLAAGDRDVVAVVRRPLEKSHPRLRTVVTELAALDTTAPVAAPGATTVALAALGTTIAKAGSEAAFRAVDLDGVLAFARWARRGGVQSFAVVSSVGASSRSRTFYLRVKGEAEDALATLGFSRLVVLRPSLLLGPRADRRRGEAAAQALAPVFNVLLPGGLRRYRALPARTVARALIAAPMGPPAHEVWEHDRIVTAAASRG